MPKKQNSFLGRFFRLLVYIAPAVLFFSYQPNFHFGENSTMNFEISLPLIWLVIFDVVGFVLITKNHKLGDILKYWYWLLFPLFLTISTIWSPNHIRGFLTVGILWLIYFAVFSLYELKKYLNSDSIKTIFYKVFLYSTLVICVWCWVQSVLDLVGLSRENSLMCQGCVTAMFGFPHPNGFAIEPQFMGNLLLAPTLLTAWLMIKKQISKKTKHKKSEPEVVFTTVTDEKPVLKYRGESASTVVKTTPREGFGFVFLLICFFLFAATLFLTFSRGAIYAFIAAMIFMTIYYIVYNKSARALLLWPVIIIAFLFTLNFQGLFAELGPTSDTFFTGISKSLNQLSLGIIDIRRPTENESQTEILPPETTEPAFDGYVAESTDFRVMLNDGAIDVWKQTPTNLLFGVGLGGAGEALYQNHKTTHPKEIVQNQYFSLLLETGLVGVALFAFTIILIIKLVIKSKISGLILPLMIAYAISICFFAGLPNALHIYLLPAILLAVGKN